MKRNVLVVLAAILAIAACEKSAPVASGKLTGSDATMLAKLPKDTLLVLGGNYLKVQQMAGSRLMKMFTSIDASTEAWTSCFLAASTLEMMGGLSLSRASGIDMRFLFRGFDIANLKGCADKASYPATVDPDGKFVAIEMKNPQVGTVKVGYLALPDGSVYGRQTMQLGQMPPVMAQLSRADLEADIAALSAGTAADNATLQATIAKTDRTKTMWFAGDASATPIGSKVGEVYGSIDGGAGFALDITAQIKQPQLADQIASGLDSARKMAGEQDAEIKALVDSITLTKDGNRLRATLKISDAQLESLMTRMAPFMGGAVKPR
ncbi:MAG: hypothetical protein AB7P03_26355 [Kofleriaceae bacterium]